MGNHLGVRRSSTVEPSFIDMMAALRGYKRGKVSLRRVTKKIRKFAMAVAYDAAHDAAEGMDRIHAAEKPRVAPDSYSV